MKSMNLNNEESHTQSSEKVASTTLTWEEHPDNPNNWSERQKWTVFGAAITATLLVGLNAAAIATPAAEIADFFRLDYSRFPNDYWPVGAWTIGAAFGPMLVLPLLENFGVKYGYLIIYALLPLFIIPQALAKNWATLIVTRAIAGFLAATIMDVPSAMLSDLWSCVADTNLPVTLFVYFYMAGVTVGPVLGAAAGNLTWRWVSYIQIIVFYAYLPILMVLVKETRSTVIRARLLKNGRITIETKKSTNSTPTPPSMTPPGSPLTPKSPRIARMPSLIQIASSGQPIEEQEVPLKTLFYEAIVRPARFISTEPVVISFTLWSAFSYGLVFLATQSIPLVFTPLHDFSPSKCGLVQLSLFIGETIGNIPILLQNSYYLRSASRNTETPGQGIPEARLPYSIPASLFGLAGGLFWYAFTSSPGLSWVLPAAGLLVAGIGIQVVVTLAVFYLTDAYGIYAGSAIAALTFGENMISAFVPLATKRMYENLGYHWAGATLAFIALGLTAAPIVLGIWGRQVRGKSKFMREAAATAAAEASSVS